MRTGERAMHVEMRPQVNERENYQHASNAQGSLLPSAESSQLNALSQVQDHLVHGICCMACITLILQLVSNCSRGQAGSKTFRGLRGSHEIFS